MSETTTLAGTPQVAPAPPFPPPVPHPHPHPPPCPGCTPPLPCCCDVQCCPTPCGRFCVDEVVDNNGAPATILEAALAFSVKGKIEFKAGNAITGKATVTLYADQLGGDVDKAIGTAPPVDITGDGTYSWTVTVPGGTLPDAPAGGSNLYRLAAVFTMVNSANKPTETSSFADLGTFRIS
jgi:hypothetical protein